MERLKDQVVIAKFENGDEILGKLTGYSSDTFTLSKPLKVALVRDPKTGAPAKAFMEVLLLAPEERFISFRTDKLLLDEPIVASLELSNLWLQETSGIVLPGQLNG